MDQERESRLKSERSQESITVPLILVISFVTLAIVAAEVGTLRGTEDADAEPSTVADAAPTATEADQPETTPETPLPTPTVPELAQDPVDEQVVERESIVDPLFIIYACDERMSPDYSVALERWGYLTHGGKRLMCLEFSAGTYEFVKHHMKLITEAEHSDASIIHSHDSDPEVWFQRILAEAGVNPAAGTGSIFTDQLGYLAIDLMLQADTPANGPVTLIQIAEFIEEYVGWMMGTGSSFTREQRTTGTALSNALGTGAAESHLSRRLDLTLDSHEQYLLLDLLVRASLVGTTGHGSREVIVRRLELAYGEYRQNASSDLHNLQFHKWLLEYPESFLDVFWPNEDWTPPGPP